MRLCTIYDVFGIKGVPTVAVAVVDLEPKVQVGKITGKLGFPARGHAHITRADPADGILGSRVSRAHTNTAGTPKLKIGLQLHLFQAIQSILNALLHRPYF